MTPAQAEYRRRTDALRASERRQTRRPGDPIPTPKPEPLTDWHALAVGIVLAVALVCLIGWPLTAWLLLHGGKA